MGGGRIIEATVEALNEYGEGVIPGKNETVKVGRTVPGDKVRVKILQEGKRYVRGELLSLLKPSERRVDPGCAAFGEGCGGCQWLHVDYPEQLYWKTYVVGDLLKRRGGLALRVDDVRGSRELVGYRNKMSLQNVDGQLAFIREYSNEPVVPQTCKVETAANQAAWSVLKDMKITPSVLQVHLRSAPNGRVGVCLFVKRYTGEVLALATRLMEQIPGIVGVGGESYREYRVLAGSPWVEQEAGGLKFRIPHNGFFQTSLDQAELLLSLAIEGLAPSPKDAVLDLYCGAGFFSLALAKLAGRVLGIENNADSIQAARANAELNGLRNVDFMATDVQRALGGLRPGQWPLMLLDPPRSGCEAAIIRAILQLKPRRIAYVSCSPESLARDLKELVAGGYRVLTVKPVDMFPHTFHVETVVTLVKE